MRYLHRDTILNTFLILACFFCVVIVIHAQSAEELQNKIQTHSATIDQLEAEIAAYQKELDSVRTQKQSLAASIKELDLTTKKFATQINLTNQKITIKNNEIKELGLMIKDKSEAISSERKGVADSLRYIRELDETTFVEILLGNESLGELWRSMEDAYKFQRDLRTHSKELAVVKTSFETSRSQAEKAKQELLQLKNDLADQKSIIEEAKKEKNKLLTQTKNQESVYASQLKQKMAQKDALEKDIRDYESKLKFILNPGTLPQPGSAPFSWPLDKFVITQLFGKTASSGRLYSSGTHNGVDFGVSIGTPVKAMADGVVEGVGNTDVQCPGVSFGKFILIKYDNGLASSYGHLSLYKVSKGERVSRGQIVGYSGNTGYSTGPHLHVSVYARDSVNLMTLPSKSCKGKILTQPIAAINGYLDPMLYLPPR
jgi:murein DD-endopeptidase MepM/ murein hydrolase activator NlpD